MPSRRNATPPLSTENDVAAWAKTHRASFETSPLVEMRGAQRVQVGFSVDFYARFPIDKVPGKNRREEALAAWERLRAILEAALPPPELRGGRVEIEPVRPAAVLRPENEMHPEVVLAARVFHQDDSFGAVTLEERERMAAFEKKLVALGLRAGHW